MRADEPRPKDSSFRCYALRASRVTSSDNKNRHCISCKNKCEGMYALLFDAVV
jgi:hypothetical protein